MIRRVTRRSRRRPAEPRKGAALGRRIDLWPFLLAALVVAATVSTVEPRLESALDRHLISERQPASAPLLSERVQAEVR